MLGKILKFSLLSTIFAMSFAYAQQAPSCLASNGQVLPVNNAQVLSWKATSKDQFHSRGHVLGTLVNIFPDATGHHHMSVQIGQNGQDTIEVIYNEDFGTMPELEIGQTIEACGDYITARGQVGTEPASPDGAIVHWVHMSTNANHLSGFVIINGDVCGQDGANAGPKAPHKNGKKYYN